jgi:hypothetical protein
MTWLAAETTRTPWAGIIAIALMFLLPLLPHGFWEGHPFHRRPRVGRPIPPPGRPRHGRPRTLVRRGPPMPARKGLPPLSAFYMAYISGQQPGHDGVYWPDRMAGWLWEHQQTAGGWCEGAWMCGGQAQATEGDHKHYRTLGHEQRGDVGLVCHEDHVYREQRKRAGVDLWAHRKRQGQWARTRRR